MAGFAFARLEVLRCTRAAAAAEALAAAADHRAATGNAFDAALAAERYADIPAFDDPAVRKAFSRQVKHARSFARQLAESALPEDALREITRVVPAVTVPAEVLREAHARWLACRQAYTETFVEDFERARGAIRQMYADDARLQEAVFLESAEAFARIQQLISTAGPRNSRARQRERLGAMYAQRFCAKNDTNSICGPHRTAFTTADDPAAPAEITVIAEDVRRVTYFSHWAAQRLLDTAVQRAGAEVVTLRAHPTARLTGNSLAWCVMEHDATNLFRRRYARSQLPDAGVRLIEELAAPRTLTELFALAGELELDPDDITGFVDQLSDAGVVLRGPTLSPGLFYPLRAVVSEVERWPESEARTWALAEVAAIEELIAAFATAPLARRVELFGQLEARFVAATGDAATRGEGKHYADRSLLHEDCCVEIRANLGPHMASLDQTVPVLVAALELPLAVARERVREWFATRFGNATVTAIDVHRAFDEDRVLDTPASTPRAEVLTAAIARVRAAVTNAVVASPGGGPVQLSSRELAAALADVPTPDHAGYLSVDVMLRDAPATPGALVIGEVHGFFWLPTCLFDVLPPAECERVVEQMRGALREMAHGKRTAECVFMHTQATDRRFTLASTDLELVVHTDRPDAITFGALDVTLVGGELVYTLGGEEVVPLVAYSGYPFVNYTSRIAPMFDDFAERFFPESLLPEQLRKRDAPRIVIDDLVVRRRIWVRPCGEILGALVATDEADLFRRAQLLRRTLGCEANVFVSVPGEPKPVLLDFHDVFLIEGLVNVLERQAPDALLKIGEMLPGPDELTARGPDGTRTSELRIGFYRT